jgi:hypothetical protein
MSSDAEGTADEKMQWRRLARFERLIRRWKLIPFSDIAGWCARRPTSVERDPQLRAQAYRDLEQSVLDGEFGSPLKPCLAYLPAHPTGPPGRRTLRLTAGQLQRLQIGGGHPIEDIWAPIELCKRWLRRRQIDLLPSMDSDTSEIEFLDISFRPALQSPKTNSAGALKVLSRKQGRRPLKLEAVKQSMRDHIAQGVQTHESLRGMLEKNLANSYDVSRDTARKARSAILSEIDDEHPDRDK